MLGAVRGGGDKGGQMGEEEEERQGRIEKSKSPDIHKAADSDKEHGDGSASARTLSCTVKQRALWHEYVKCEK